MSFDGLRIWFLTGSQDLYGEVILAQVLQQSKEIVAGLSAAPDIPIEIVHKPTVTTPDGIRRACLDASADDSCIGVIGWMHTFSPAKMWIAGLQALQKPFLHLHTQYGAELPYGAIDMAFMNLNQSAHGDREFAYIVSRLRLPRKTIAGHWQEPGVQARIGAWMRAAAGAHEARTPADHPLRRQHARGGRHRRRQGRGAGAPRARPATPTRSTSSPRWWSRSPMPRSSGSVPSTTRPTTSCRRCAPGASDAASLRDAARIELGLRAFLAEHGDRWPSSIPSRTSAA